MEKDNSHSKDASFKNKKAPDILPVAAFSEEHYSKDIDPHEPLYIRSGGDPKAFPRLHNYEPRPVTQTEESSSQGSTKEKPSQNTR